VDSPTTLGIGSEVLGYRVESLAGQGGMGVVYRAHDQRLKRTVALKLIVPELALDERFRERFAREAELAMALEHPNVVPIHDAGRSDGQLYLVMRFVEGTDLRSLLREEGALEPRRALAIMSQIANALDAAHAKGLVHRDVKPSNVLLDQSEHVYLADFGLTRRVAEGGGQFTGARSLGTPAYLAPEQIEGGLVDGRADVYSLGCLLYECLTGEPPFIGPSRLAVAWAHLEEAPPRISARDRRLPEELDDVIRKAMAKKPDDRYENCRGLVVEAEAALGLHQPAPHRRRVLFAGLALLIAVAAGIAAAASRSRARQPGRALRPIQRSSSASILPRIASSPRSTSVPRRRRLRSADEPSGSTTEGTTPFPRSMRARTRCCTRPKSLSPPARAASGSRSRRARSVWRSVPRRPAAQRSVRQTLLASAAPQFRLRLPRNARASRLVRKEKRTKTLTGRTAQRDDASASLVVSCGACNHPRTRARITRLRLAG
jgi:serine/threonine protein kinase